jgi:hypothetical protein
MSMLKVRQPRDRGDWEPPAIKRRRLERDIDSVLRETLRRSRIDTQRQRSTDARAISADVEVA